MARLSKEKLKEQGKQKYERVLKNGKIETSYLTIEQALEQNYCGMCQKFVGKTTEFYADPLEGLCHSCKEKLEKILNFFDCGITDHKEYIGMFDDGNYYV